MYRRRDPSPSAERLLSTPSTILVPALAIGLMACAGGPERIALPSEPLGAVGCVVWVHGRGDTGAQARVVDGRAEISPDGNAEYEDGFEWRYGSVDDLAAASDIVESAIDGAGCGEVVVAGFSNGAAFAAALYCSGTTFDGRLTGVVVDDPVTDEGVLGCEQPAEVPVALYWTGALDDQSRPGTPCADVGFTCAGDVLIGIDAYADALGTSSIPSPYTEHRWYRTAPEIDDWLSTSG